MFRSTFLLGFFFSCLITAKADASSFLVDGQPISEANVYYVVRILQNGMDAIYTHISYESGVDDASLAQLNEVLSPYGIVANCVGSSGNAIEMIFTGNIFAAGFIEEEIRDPNPRRVTLLPVPKPQEILQTPPPPHRRTISDRYNDFCFRTLLWIFQ